jgi:hypothetical protein
MISATVRGAALFAAALLAWGCASTNVERAKDLSSAGVQYARATAAVVDVAIDASIDADSAAQVRSKPRPSNLLPPEESRKRLERLDSDLVDSVAYYGKLRASIGTLEAYFQALQALADGSQADATQAAVSTLADRVNTLNDVLAGGGAGVRPVLSEGQKNALAALGKQVAKQVHGAVVGRALERDAPIIGRAILLQEKILAAAESDIADKIAEENNRFYVDRVLTPYQRATIDAGWIDDRRTYIKVKAMGKTIEAVTSAQAAARQMEATWQKILSGEYSAAEMAAILRETDELLAAVVALKAAEKPKAAP